MDKRYDIRPVCKQLNIWQTSDTDVPESTQFHDLVESLKLSKEIKGLVNAAFSVEI